MPSRALPAKAVLCATAVDDTLAKLFYANEQWSEAVKTADPRYPRYRSTPSSSISLPISVRFSGLDDRNFGLPCPQKRHHCLAPRLHLRPSYHPERVLDRVETFTTAYCLVGHPYLSAFWESGWIFAPAWHVTRLAQVARGLTHCHDGYDFRQGERTLCWYHQGGLCEGAHEA